MSFQRKMPAVFATKKGQSHLDHMLDFGPEKDEAPVAQSANSLDRLKQIVKKLQEINKRIDDLSHRL
jgi:hypothetical protein